MECLTRWAVGVVLRIFSQQDTGESVKHGSRIVRG
jgi:hypothetical protein